jgi:tRNA(Arg) A34 adenosine deaminase TadA
MVANENDSAQSALDAEQRRLDAELHDLDAEQGHLGAKQGHLEMMSRAIVEARRAAQAGEVPVGAVIARAGGVVGVGHNRSIASHDPTAHAEVEAIRAAAVALGAYRLEDASLYVTLEPCVMCVGAIINARIARVYYGARDRKAGALGSVYDIGRDGRLNHRVEVYGGLMESACAKLLRDFFRARR